MSTDWNSAACLGENPELFFPVGSTGPALLQIEEAKKVCRRCPIRDACLKWAFSARQEFGVWGGMSEDERREFRTGRVEPKVRKRRLRDSIPLPVGGSMVDELVVEALMSGASVDGMPRNERMEAAARLVIEGSETRGVARRFGVKEESIRHRIRMKEKLAKG